MIHKLNDYDLRPEFLDGVDLDKLCKNTVVKNTTIYECLMGISRPSRGGDLYSVIWDIKKITFPSFQKQIKAHKKNVEMIRNTHFSINRIVNTYKVSNIRMKSLSDQIPSVSFGSKNLYNVNSEEFKAIGLKLKGTPRSSNPKKLEGEISKKHWDETNKTLDDLIVADKPKDNPKEKDIRIDWLLVVVIFNAVLTIVGLLK